MIDVRIGRLVHTEWLEVELWFALHRDALTIATTTAAELATICVASADREIDAWAATRGEFFQLLACDAA